MANNTYDLIDSVRDSQGRGFVPGNLQSFYEIMHSYGIPTADPASTGALFDLTTNKVARVAVRRMKDRVPVKTGQTQRAIRFAGARIARRRRGRFRFRQFPSRVRIQTPLWHVLESGRMAGRTYNPRYGRVTRYSSAPPYPFIFPVLYEEQDVLVAAFRKGFDESLRKFKVNNPRLLRMIDQRRAFIRG